jgi:hypothetical protein
MKKIRFYRVVKNMRKNLIILSKRERLYQVVQSFLKKTLIKYFVYRYSISIIFEIICFSSSVKEFSGRIKDIRNDP